MEYQTVIAERRDSVGIITLNRPERLNAINHTLAVEWRDALISMNEDPEIASIVFTGAGRGFCSGADMSRFEQAVDGEGESVSSPSWSVEEWVELMAKSKPTVAAINGIVVGAGLSRVLHCDVLIASRAARLSPRFIKVGLSPGMASTAMLTRMVGPQHAADLMLSGRIVDAEEAHKIGLVLAVTEPEDLLPTAIRLANDYGQNSPRLLRQTRQLLARNALEPDLFEVIAREKVGQQRFHGSSEHKEAVAAFRENRPADFRNLVD